MLAAVALAVGGTVAPMQVLAFAVLWYGGEFLLARAAGWPASAVDVLAWLCRDALVPALWTAAWFGNGFDWRGTPMTVADPLAHGTSNGAPGLAKP